jgi:hypothetical protein
MTCDVMEKTMLIGLLILAALGLTGVIYLNYKMWMER